MLKSALLSTAGALAVAAIFATAAIGPPAMADPAKCTNCDCACGRCHTISKGIYCCPCKLKPKSKPSTSTGLPGFKSLPQSTRPPRTMRSR